MTVQAGAVRRRLTSEQTRERDSLVAVERTGREALAEMRRLVGMLNEEDDPQLCTAAGHAGAGRADRHRVRAAGLPVDLEVEGARRELPPGVDLAAYRVVQEALTNTLKHAGPAHAWVAICWTDEELRIEVANNGRNTRPATGYGHAGMRERVRLYGGRLESGPRADGGYVVRALRADRIRSVSSPIGVVIADDQPMVRQGFRMILEAEAGIDVVGEAADGDEAVRLSPPRPDVTLIDVRMPVLDGLTATRQVIALVPGTRVLIFTTFDVDAYVYEALRAGVSGFVLKDAPADQLVMRCASSRPATR